MDIMTAEINDESAAQATPAQEKQKLVAGRVDSEHERMLNEILSRKRISFKGQLDQWIELEHRYINR